MSEHGSQYRLIGLVVSILGLLVAVIGLIVTCPPPEHGAMILKPTVLQSSSQKQPSEPSDMGQGITIADPKRDAAIKRELIAERPDRVRILGGDVLLVFYPGSLSPKFDSSQGSMRVERAPGSIAVLNCADLSVVPITTVTVADSGKENFSFEGKVYEIHILSHGLSTAKYGQVADAWVKLEAYAVEP